MSKQSFTYSGEAKVRRLAMKRAKKEGKTISDIIEMAMMGYVAAKEWKDMQGKPLTPNSIILDPRPLNK